MLGMRILENLARTLMLHYELVKTPFIQKRIKAEDPTFQYTFQVGSNCRVRPLHLTSSQNLQYKHLDDLIIVDTTYRSNM